LVYPPSKQRDIGKRARQCWHLMIIGDELWLSSRLPPGCVSADVLTSTYPFQHGKLTMYQHLQAQHFGWEGRVSQGQELEEFCKQIMITYEEEARLQIPESHHSLHIVSTDVHHANPLYLPSIRNEHGDSPRRPRRPALPHPLPIQPIQLPTASNQCLLPYLHNTDVFADCLN